MTIQLVQNQNKLTKKWPSVNGGSSVFSTFCEGRTHHWKGVTQTLQNCINPSSAKTFSGFSQEAWEHSYFFKTQIPLRFHITVSHAVIPRLERVTAYRGGLVYIRISTYTFLKFCENFRCEKMKSHETSKNWVWVLAIFKSRLPGFSGGNTGHCHVVTCVKCPLETPRMPRW